MKHTLLLILSLTGVSLAQTNYVALDGLHVPPFTNWMTAATNIQAAVDIAQDGDLVLVMTGEYASGGRPAPGQSLTNRLVVTNCITVQSVFGPQHTIIAGAPDPVLTNGPQAVRGAYLANGAILSGFTITRGCTSNAGTNDLTGGGVFMVNSAGLSNAHVVYNQAYALGGGIRCLSNSWITGCLVISNGAGSMGGGVFLEYKAAIYSSTISYNGGIRRAMRDELPMAGGIYGYIALIKDCVIEHNRGELVDAVMIHESDMVGSQIAGHKHSLSRLCVVLSDAHMAGCSLSNNGDMSSYLVESWTYFTGTSTVRRSCIRLNQSGTIIRGVTSVENCVIAGTDAQNQNITAKNIFGCTVYNIASLTATTLYNTIVCGGVSNQINQDCDVRFCSGSVFSNRMGCITADPLFHGAASGDFRLRRDSPCINAGTNMAELGAWDVAGQPRVRGFRVDMGAYEFSTTGPCVAVTERVIDFGNIVVGDTATNTVRVVNLGDELVTGMATGAVAPFAILADAEYVVQSDTYHDVTCTFTPSAEGMHSNVIVLLGGGNQTVALYGTGVPEPLPVFVATLIISCLCSRKAHIACFHNV